MTRFTLQPGPGDRTTAATAEQAAQAALRELPEALIVVFDRDLRFRLAAGQALERRGQPAAFAPGAAAAEAFPAELWEQMEPLFCSALEGETRSRELWVGDEGHCLMLDVGPLRQGGGEQDAVSGGVAVVRDVTERRRASLLEARPQSGFEEVFERSPVGTGLLDRDGRWLLVNRALCEITGYTPDELIGKRFDGIVHPDDVYNDTAQRELLLAGELSALQVEKRYFDAAGEVVSAIFSMSLVRDGEGKPLHFIAQLQDISERKLLEEHLRELADHDTLTGVRNGRLFEHDLRLQLARARRYGETAALLLVELDDLDELVERHGVRTGERVLRSVARALTRRLRETDLIARLEDDRFAVLLPHIDEEGAGVVAGVLERVIPASDVDVGECVLHPRASVGVALIDARSEGPEHVLGRADAAMQSARASRRRQV